MANELKVFGSAVFTKGGSSLVIEMPAPVSVTITGTQGIKAVQSVGTSEEALILGEVSAAGGWYFIRNLDATNVVTLKPASGGTATTRVNPGEFAMGRFATTVSAPFVQSNTTAALIEYLLVPA
jgi:hypothetical protein